VENSFDGHEKAFSIVRNGISQKDGGILSAGRFLFRGVKKKFQPLALRPIKKRNQFYNNRLEKYLLSTCLWGGGVL
jgi:hypothetical protein